MTECPNGNHVRRGEDANYCVRCGEPLSDTLSVAEKRAKLLEAHSVLQDMLGSPTNPDKFREAVETMEKYHADLDGDTRVTPQEVEDYQEGQR